MEEGRATEVKDNLKTHVESLVGHVTDYAETKFDLTLLKTTDKLASTLSSATSAIIVGVLAFFVFLFASLGTAWWLGQELNNAAEGYFIVAGFFVFITLIAFLFRRMLFKPLVTNIFLKHLYDK